MISSASTLLLATLVFNAASVFGAPIRIADTSSVIARAEIDTPAQPIARAVVVDVEDNRRRSRLGHISRRLARMTTDEVDTSSDQSEQTTPPEPVNPAPVVEHKHKHKGHQRRYPRRVLHDFYEKREPATSIKETTIVVTKNTAFDTPADAAAFQGAQGAAGSANAIPSAVSVAVSVSGIPAADASGVSTLVSISQTTTIASPDAAATGSAGATNTAPPAETTTAAAGDATATTAAADATSTSASGDASATTSASAGDATSTGEASATTSAAAGQPTTTGEPSTTTSAAAGDATATSTATDSAASPDATGTTGGDKAAAADGDKTPTVCVPPTTDGSCPAASGTAGSPEPTSTDAAGDKSTEARRWVKASSQPIARRSASSGASWASAVRRQLMNSH